MSQETAGHLEVDDRGSVLVVRVDGGPHQVIGPEIAHQLEALVDRVDADPQVHAVVLTMFAFMSGLAVGRLVSILADGWSQRRPVGGRCRGFAAHTPPAGQRSSYLPNATTIASAPALHHLDQESQ